MDAIEAAASANFSAVRRERTMEENKTKAKISAGFGKNGDGWFRLTAFGTHENTVEAMQRVKKLLSK